MVQVQVLLSAFLLNFCIHLGHFGSLKLCPMQKGGKKKNINQTLLSRAKRGTRILDMLDATSVFTLAS